MKKWSQRRNSHREGKHLTNKATSRDPGAASDFAQARSEDVGSPIAATPILPHPSPIPHFRLWTDLPSCCPSDGGGGGGSIPWRSTPCQPPPRPSWPPRLLRELPWFWSGETWRCRSWLFLCLMAAMALTCDWRLKNLTGHAMKWEKRKFLFFACLSPTEYLFD